MSKRNSLNPDDADDSDSSSSLSPVRLPKRSATVSPSTRCSFRSYQARRRSDFNLNVDMEREKERERRQRRMSRERSEGRRKPLRKTNSEPNVEATTIDLNALKQLLDSLPKFGHQDSDSGGEEMSTEIEELRDAAKSIQSLQRVLKLPLQHSSDKGVFSDTDYSTIDTNSTVEGSRASGISTRLGHPRGVMQFLPSIRQEQFVPSADCYRSHAPVSRKTSAPDGFLPLNLSLPEAITSRPSSRRRGVVDDMYSSSAQLLESKNSESLPGFSRFSKLIKSFRSRQSSPEPHASISWNPYVYSESAGEEGTMEDSLLEADILLWKKRSRASLRRHYSVRNLAAKELLETEKSFVEGLKYLVNKYMRPLRQPLECTLIEPQLVDKIFYKLPEILAHHQVLLETLKVRIDGDAWHKDSLVGDVLLEHFSKQSMVETYISFVNNFKFAKNAIAQARAKQSFEKYYNRCCRDHHNKLDLDSLLISPIQRIPRYELLAKQLLKHTPAQHEDHERLIRALRHIHNLAVAINQHKEANEQMEQRLREIEAIVDGLDDLVSTGRTLIRYDIITMKTRDSTKQRCVFMLSDQLLLTSVRRKNNLRGAKMITQSHDFLDSNRFKLLIKISLEDVEIGKDTLTMLQETQNAIEAMSEDAKVLKKTIELANLLKANKEKLLSVLDEMDGDNSVRLRSLTDQLTNNPELTTVLLNVTTVNGVEKVPLEFGSAEKRAVWEGAFKETKSVLINQQITTQPSQLKSVIAHQTRPGLQMRTASVVPGKRPDSAPSVWLTASDKFSGQVAVISLENGDPTIESCAGIGNAAVTAMCTVPSIKKPKKKKMRSQKSLDILNKNESLLDLNSSGESSDSSSDESFSPQSGQATVWIGNEDGEVFVVNSTERVRTRVRERVARLIHPVTAICSSSTSVFVATALSSGGPLTSPKIGTDKVQILCFKTNQENSWDLEGFSSMSHPLTRPVSMMIPIGRRILLSSAHQIYAFSAHDYYWETPTDVLSCSDSISLLCSSGATVFAVGTKATTVHVLDAFSLKVINHFSIAPIIRSQLAGREDILREHKMGCLRISCMAAARSLLWIGTSAGFIISTPVHCAKMQPTPPLTVCEMGHCGPCRVLLPVHVALSRKRKRMSLNTPSQQASQLLVLSCGEGIDEKSSEGDPSTDAVNHLIFWKAN